MHSLETTDRSDERLGNHKQMVAPRSIQDIPRYTLIGPRSSSTNCENARFPVLGCPAGGEIGMWVGKSRVNSLPKVNSLILPASPGIFERNVTAAKEARAPPRE